MNEYNVKARATFTGTVKGQGRLTTAGLETDFSAPPELAGIGLGTDPEALLLSASCTCLLITTAAIFSREGLSGATLAVKSEGEVLGYPALEFKKITHRLEIDLMPGSPVEALEKAKALVGVAEKACMISKALRNGIQIEVSADIAVGRPK